MHLLIDVRTSCLSDIPNLYYAQMWADIWLSYHRNDRITFLAFEGDPVEGYECIFLSRNWVLLQKKLASHNYGPDRIVSFSKFPPIDRGIPSLLHVDELTHKLYPHTQEGFFTRYRSESQYKKNLKFSSHIITPNVAIRETLGELYGVNESKITLLPYLSAGDKKKHRDQSILPHGISGEYFITEGTPGDEWNPRGLLEAFQRYIHEKNGNRQLIIIGDLGINLSNLSLLIRSHGLIEKVKILSVISQEERSLLYAHAKGWIYIGYYYSRGSSVELASSYDIPLYLSDISGLIGYNGVYIHPNHVDTLADILSNSHMDGISHPKNDNQEIMRVYARIISE